MVVIQARSKRKSTGGRYKDTLTKRMTRQGHKPTLTKLDEIKNKVVNTRGVNKKVKLMASNVANIYDSKKKKYVKANIKNISESPSNRHYVRRNIMTKGAIIETDIGKAKVTSRPGQDGTINAVLI